MSLLSDYDWQTKYDADGRSLVDTFFVPALESATRYDRTTGYFSAGATRDGGHEDGWEREVGAHALDQALVFPEEIQRRDGEVRSGCSELERIKDDVWQKRTSSNFQ